MAVWLGAPTALNGRRSFDSSQASSCRCGTLELLVSTNPADTSFLVLHADGEFWEPNQVCYADHTKTQIDLTFETFDTPQRSTSGAPDSLQFQFDARRGFESGDIVHDGLNASYLQTVHSPRTLAHAPNISRARGSRSDKSEVFVLQHFCARHLKNNFHTARMPCSALFLIHHSRHVHRARKLPHHHCSLQIGLPLQPRCLADFLNNLFSQVMSPTLRNTYCFTLEKEQSRIYL